MGDGILTMIHIIIRWVLCPLPYMAKSLDIAMLYGRMITTQPVTA